MNRGGLFRYIDATSKDFYYYFLITLEMFQPVLARTRQWNLISVPGVSVSVVWQSGDLESGPGPEMPGPDPEGLGLLLQCWALGNL